MKFKFLNTVFASSILLLSTASQAGLLTLEFTNTLDNMLADVRSNFAPQGLGYDASTNELLFLQQSSQTIFNTDLSGIIQSSSPLNYNHTTSIAADANNYYFSDYTANSGGLDVFSQNKSTGVITAISSDKAAYGGYPIDVRNGVLYRTNNSSTYSWSGLNEILISSVTNADAGIQRVSLATSIGIGDIAIDSGRNQVWTIDYTANAMLRQFDLATGAELSSHALGFDGLSAGLTFANDKLYYYDHNSGSGSTLSAYSLQSNSQEVPEPSTLAIFALGMIGLASRRFKKQS